MKILVVIQVCRKACNTNIDKKLKVLKLSWIVPNVGSLLNYIIFWTVHVNIFFNAHLFQTRVIWILYEETLNESQSLADVSCCLLAYMLV
jgi:hypothetical protein